MSHPKPSGTPQPRRPPASEAPCTAHGGRAPQVKAAAARRVARATLEGEVGRLLAEIGNDPVPDLIDGLLIAVTHCAQMVAVYRVVVTRLHAHED